MKGCLKLSPMPSHTQVQYLNVNTPNEHDGSGGETRCCHTPPVTALPTQSQRKCVAFCAQGSETVYAADEWDRTPTEPARKLSYQDLLELKEIQRSLPHANQPPDLVTGRPAKQFLSGVPIVLLPLLNSGGGNNNQGASNPEEGPRHTCISDVHGHANEPPNLPSQAPSQSPAQTSVRPSFPFPPCPVPFFGPASTPSFTSARTPHSPTSPSQPWSMKFQSQNKTKFSSSSPSSATCLAPSLYPSSSYSNRPSYPHSKLHQQSPQTQSQTQSRTSWTAPSSLNHLMPSSSPVKTREKPKFEFITLLDSGAETGLGGGVGSLEVTSSAKVGRLAEAPLHPISKISSGLIEVERDHDDDHDLEDHDQDHDLTGSSSCPSLCASSCSSSCSASEVDTDHEHESEVEVEGLDRYGREHDAAAKCSSMPCLTVDVGLQTKKKEKKRKFMLVNDMEIELDDSGSESESEDEAEDSVALSGKITSASTTTTMTKMTATENTTTTTSTDTTSSSSPPSPRSIVVPAPIKSGLWGSHPPPPPFSSASSTLITPPTTPPSEPRCGTHKLLYSPPTSCNGRSMKVSRERSGSVGSDTSGGGGGGGSSPSRNMCNGMNGMGMLKVKAKEQRLQIH